MSQSMKKRFPSITSIDVESDGNTSFLRAARNGQLDKVLEHLKSNIDINTSNANGLNALHLASKDGHVEIVDELLKRGAVVDAATKKGNTALHIASLAGQEEVVKLLVQHGASVNVQSQNGFTPLYMAAQENHDNVVKYLLANGANQSLSTEDGFTPLAVAMQQGHDKVVTVLLENDTRGKVRLPALHIAAKKDDVKAAKLLLENEHNPDVTSKSGFTPLHIASHYGNQQIANLLIQKGADVNYAAKHNITPLHVAAKWGKTNMVAILLENSATIESKTRDGLTPLHCAARSGHEQVVDMLLEKGAPISSKTKNGLAPLHMAAQGDHVDAARILLYHRAPVDEVTVDYLTALHVAAHCGHVRVAKLLLDRQADANARALNGFTPLHIACKKNRIKVVELLLKHGASIGATTESGLTPLHVASFMGCMNIVIYLLQHDANPDVPTVRGETPLHLAARANQTDIIRILLRNGSQVDARAREQQTPLHIASRLGNVDIVMLLLQHGAKVDNTTKDMYTALHIAAKEGQDEVAAVLIDNGASINSTTKKGFTPLHLASKYGHLKVAKLLLQKEAPVDAQGKNGVTPLHVASHYDHQNVALLLLDKGASPHATAKNGHTPLHIAARKNQMDIANTLLEYGAQPNAESKAGFTPLHLSAQEGHTDLSALLIEHKANVNHEAKNGLTPLHLCAQEDRVPVAEVLCKNGAEVDTATKAGYTPLHIACHYGQTNMVRFLLQNGASVESSTSLGYTPLHQAAQQGHANIVNILLENKADPNAETTNGQTPLNIAQKLGYISVIETLKLVTTTTTITTTTTTNLEEKYRVQAPEAMHETFMSDSEEEGGEDAVLGDQTYRYLTADEMKSLGDDSLPIDVTRDERIDSNRMISSMDSNMLPPHHIEDSISPEHISRNYVEYIKKYTPDNVEIDRHPVNIGFLVSFLVDARGGAMRGCRHSGVKVIVPPRSAGSPTRITCRYVRAQRTPHPPPLMEGEALASRVLELGPVGAKFLGPVIIEIPHFAALRGKEREIVILRSDNGESWKEHTVDATEDILNEVLHDSFEAEDLNQMEDISSGRITRIVTQDFPQYFAVVSRVRQEVHAIGPEGGMVSSTVVPQVQAIFPEGALTKKIKVGLQAQPIDPELTAKLLGHGVAVSPVVTVEPRRRKFHKAIRLNMPAPTAHSQGMINQYSGSAPTLRLLCSITGGTTRAQWEDVTGSTPLTFVNDVVSFTTTVSARFWLMDCRNIGDATKMATELYKEAIHVPFMAKFVVFAKRVDPLEARLRVFCMTDDKEDKTLEHQEHFTEVAKSRDVEVLEGKPQFIEFAGNLVPITKSGEQLQFSFRAFRENRLPFSVRVKDQHAEAVSRCLFMKEAKVPKGEQPQQPICILNIVLPDDIVTDTISLTDTDSIKKHMFLSESYDYCRPDPRLADMSNLLGEDWVQLAHQLGLTTSEVNVIKSEYPESVAKQAQSMLRMWLSQSGNKAQTNTLENALRRIGREDIIPQCLNVDQTSQTITRIKQEEIGYRLKKDSVDKVDISKEAAEQRATDKKKIESFDKYSAEEKAVEKSESEEEDTFDKTVTERREQIEKRLSAERMIPASSQRREIVQEITSIKEQSLVEEKINEVQQKVTEPLTETKTTVTKTVTKTTRPEANTVSESVQEKTTIPSNLKDSETVKKPTKEITKTTVTETHKVQDDKTMHKTAEDSELLEGVTQRFEDTKKVVPKLIVDKDPSSPKFSKTPPPSPADFLSREQAAAVQEWDATTQPGKSVQGPAIGQVAAEQGKSTSTTRYIAVNEDLSLLDTPVGQNLTGLSIDRNIILANLRSLFDQTNAFIVSESRAEPYHVHTEKHYKIYKEINLEEKPGTKDDKKNKKGFFGTIKTFVGKSLDHSDSDSEISPKKDKKVKKEKKDKIKKKTESEVVPDIPQRPPRKPKLPTPTEERKEYADIPYVEASPDQPPSYMPPVVPDVISDISNAEFRLQNASLPNVPVTNLDDTTELDINEHVKEQANVIVKGIISESEKAAKDRLQKSPKSKKTKVVIVEEKVIKTFKPITVEEEEFTIVVDPTKKGTHKKSRETFTLNIDESIGKIEKEILEKSPILPDEKIVKPVAYFEAPVRLSRAEDNVYEDINEPLVSHPPDNLVSVPESLQIPHEIMKKVTTNLIENEIAFTGWAEDKYNICNKSKMEPTEQTKEKPESQKLKRKHKIFGLFRKSSKDTEDSDDDNSKRDIIEKQDRESSIEKDTEDSEEHKKGFFGLFGKKTKKNEKESTEFMEETSTIKPHFSEKSIKDINYTSAFLKQEVEKYEDGPKMKKALPAEVDSSKPKPRQKEHFIIDELQISQTEKNSKSKEKEDKGFLGLFKKSKKDETESNFKSPDTLKKVMSDTTTFLKKEVDKYNDVRPLLNNEIIKSSAESKNVVITNESKSTSQDQELNFHHEFLHTEIQKYHDVRSVIKNPEPSKIATVKGMQETGTFLKEEVSRYHDVRLTSAEQTELPQESKETLKRESKGFLGFFKNATESDSTIKGKYEKSTTESILSETATNDKENTNIFLNKEVSIYHDVRPVIDVPKKDDLVQNKDEASNKGGFMGLFIKKKVEEDLSKSKKHIERMEYSTSTATKNEKPDSDEAKLSLDEKTQIKKVFHQDSLKASKEQGDIEQIQICFKPCETTNFLNTELVKYEDAKPEESISSQGHKIKRDTAEIKKGVFPPLSESTLLDMITTSNFIREEVSKYHDVKPIKEAVVLYPHEEKSKEKTSKGGKLFGLFTKKKSQDKEGSAEKEVESGKNEHKSRRKAKSKSEGKPVDTPEIKMEHKHEYEAKLQSKTKIIISEKVLKDMLDSNNFLQREIDRYYDVKELPQKLETENKIEKNVQEKNVQEKNVSFFGLFSKKNKPRGKSDDKKEPQHVLNMKHSYEFLQNEVSNYYDVKPIINEKCKKFPATENVQENQASQLASPKKKPKEKKPERNHDIFEEVESKDDEALKKQKITTVTKEFTPKGEKVVTVTKEIIAVDPTVMRDLTDLDEDIKCKIESAREESKALGNNKPFVRENFTVETKIINRIIPLLPENKLEKETEKSTQVTAALSENNMQNSTTVHELTKTKDVDKSAGIAVGDIKSDTKKFLYEELRNYESSTLDVREETPVVEEPRAKRSGIFGILGKRASQEKEIRQESFEKSNESESKFSKRERKKSMSPFKIFEKKQKNADESEKAPITLPRDTEVITENKIEINTSFDAEELHTNKKDKRIAVGNKIIISEGALKDMLDSNTFLQGEINHYHDVNIFRQKLEPENKTKENLKEKNVGFFGLFSKKSKERENTEGKTKELAQFILNKNHTTEFLQEEVNNYYDAKLVLNTESKKSPSIEDAEAILKRPDTETKESKDKKATKNTKIFEETESKEDDTSKLLNITTVTNEYTPTGKTVITTTKKSIVLDPTIKKDLSDLDEVIQYKIESARKEAEALDNEESETKIIDRFKSIPPEKDLYIRSEDRSVDGIYFHEQTKADCIDKCTENIPKDIKNDTIKFLHEEKCNYDITSEIKERSPIVNEIKDKRSGIFGIFGKRTSQEREVPEEFLDKPKDLETKLNKKGRKKSGSPFKIFDKKQKNEDELDTYKIHATKAADSGAAKGVKIEELVDSKKTAFQLEEPCPKREDKKKGSGFFSMFTKSIDLTEDKAKTELPIIGYNKYDLDLLKTLQDTENFLNTEVTNYEDQKPEITTDLDEDNESSKPGLFAIFRKKDKQESPLFSKKMLKKQKRDTYFEENEQLRVMEKINRAFKEEKESVAEKETIPEGTFKDIEETIHDIKMETDLLPDNIEKEIKHKKVAFSNLKEDIRSDVEQSYLKNNNEEIKAARVTLMNTEDIVKSKVNETSKILTEATVKKQEYPQKSLYELDENIHINKPIEIIKENTSTVTEDDIKSDTQKKTKRIGFLSKLGDKIIGKSDKTNTKSKTGSTEFKSSEQGESEKPTDIFDDYETKQDLPTEGLSSFTTEVLKSFDDKMEYVKDKRNVAKETILKTTSEIDGDGQNIDLVVEIEDSNQRNKKSIPPVATDINKKCTEKFLLEVDKTFDKTMKLSEEISKEQCYKEMLNFLENEKAEATKNLEKTVCNADPKLNTEVTGIASVISQQVKEQIEKTEDKVKEDLLLNQQHGLEEKATEVKYLAVATAEEVIKQTKDGTKKAAKKGSGFFSKLTNKISGKGKDLEKHIDNTLQATKETTELMKSDINKDLDKAKVTFNDNIEKISVKDLTVDTNENIDDATKPINEDYSIAKSTTDGTLQDISDGAIRSKVKLESDITELKKETIKDINDKSKEINKERTQIVKISKEMLDNVSNAIEEKNKAISQIKDQSKTSYTEKVGAITSDVRNFQKETEQTFKDIQADSCEIIEKYNEQLEKTHDSIEKSIEEAKKMTQECKEKMDHQQASIKGSIKTIVQDTTRQAECEIQKDIDADNNLLENYIEKNEDELKKEPKSIVTKREETYTKIDQLGNKVSENIAELQKSVENAKEKSTQEGPDKFKMDFKLPLITSKDDGINKTNETKSASDELVDNITNLADKPVKVSKDSLLKKNIPKEKDTQHERDPDTLLGINEENIDTKNFLKHVPESLDDLKKQYDCKKENKFNYPIKTETNKDQEEPLKFYEKDGTLHAKDEEHIDPKYSSKHIQEFIIEDLKKEGKEDKTEITEDPEKPCNSSIKDSTLHAGDEQKILTKFSPKHIQEFFDDFKKESEENYENIDKAWTTEEQIEICKPRIKDDTLHATGEQNVGTKYSSKYVEGFLENAKTVPEYNKDKTPIHTPGVSYNVEQIPMESNYISIKTDYTEEQVIKPANSPKYDKQIILDFLTQEKLGKDLNYDQIHRTVSDYGAHIRVEDPSTTGNISEANIDLSNLPSNDDFCGKSRPDSVAYVTSPTLPRRAASQRLSKGERPEVMEVTNITGDNLSDDESYIVTEPDECFGNKKETGRKPLFHIESEDDENLDLLRPDIVKRSDSMKSNVLETLSESAVDMLLDNLTKDLSEASNQTKKSSEMDIKLKEQRLKEHKKESQEEVEIIEQKLRDLDKALDSLEQVDIQVDPDSKADSKTKKKLKRVERKFERMASEVLEKDVEEKRIKATTPEVEEKRESEFQKLVSQLSIEEVSDFQREYSNLWDETTFSKSEDWNSKTPDSQADVQELPKGDEKIDAFTGQQAESSRQAETEESHEKGGSGEAKPTKVADQHQLSGEMKELLKELEKESKQ